MEVILKEDVPKLGNRGEVVKVAEGYGRNFLLPKKLAIEATLANKTVIEQMKAASVRRSAKEKTEAEALAKQFDGLEVKFLRKSGETDQLFGSVTAGDIADALEKKSFHIDRRKIQLHESLKSVGEFIVVRAGRIEPTGTQSAHRYCYLRGSRVTLCALPAEFQCRSRIGPAPFATRLARRSRRSGFRIQGLFDFFPQPTVCRIILHTLVPV